MMQFVGFIALTIVFGAVAMVATLFVAQRRGFLGANPFAARSAERAASGFENCSEERLNLLLHGHLAKGDPIDIANFAAFLHFNGQRVTESPRITTEQAERLKRLPRVHGVGRDAGCPSALVVYFEREPTDDDLRALYAALDAMMKGTP